MAIWGTGNFERDDALNVLDFLSNEIIEDIRKCFTYDSEKSLYEDFGESDIVARVDILWTLSKHYQYTLHLDAQEIATWKHDYLDTFDRTIHHYSSSPEYIKTRRQIVADTFDKFHDLVRKSWED